MGVWCCLYLCCCDCLLFPSRCRCCILLIRTFVVCVSLCPNWISFSCVDYICFCLCVCLCLPVCLSVCLCLCVGMCATHTPRRIHSTRSRSRRPLKSDGNFYSVNSVRLSVLFPVLFIVCVYFMFVCTHYVYVCCLCYLLLFVHSHFVYLCVCVCVSVCACVCLCVCVYYIIISVHFSSISITL